MSFARPVHSLAAAGLGLWLGLAPTPALAEVDWSGYDRLLKAHVHDGVVDYAGIATERAVLKATVGAIAKAAPAAAGSGPARFAAWLNAYNALVIDAILDGKSPGSIVSRLTFFKVDQYPVFGQRMSLHDMENVHIRPSFQDPRAHFALVCASQSCPKLRPEAYSGAKLSSQLDDQATRFLGDGARNQFDARTKIAKISMIFKWYEDDFRAAADTVPKYLRRFAPAAAKAWLLSPDAKIEYLPYDWSLNGHR